MDEKRWHLYVLKLEQGKYYVGITSKSPQIRFEQHKNGFAGATWTKKYKPIEIFYTQDLGNISKDKAELFESRVTREYVNKYGLANVRGGDLSYSGYLLKVGNRYIKGWQIESGFTALLLFALCFYILFAKY